MIFSDLIQQPPHLHTFGFCNRAYKWAYLYEVAKKNNLQISVDWPEYNHLDLPITIFGLNLEAQGFKLQDIKPDYILNPEINWIEKSNWNFDRELKADMNIKYIHLKDKELLSKIEKFTLNLVGVHIRRTDFMPYQGHPKANYRMPDNYYMDLMDKILIKNKNQKFYISSDFSDIKLGSFYSKYKGKIYNYSDIFNTSDIDLIKLIDLYSLAHCKLIIQSMSTFSTFAQRYKGRPSIWPASVNLNILDVI